jgi:hypothetical protein
MKLATPQRIFELAAQPTGCQPISGTVLMEPRISLIAKRLRALLRVVQLESGGQPIEIESFRLKRLDAWASAPAASPAAELWHISSACNMRCPFCYEEGDPPRGPAQGRAGVRSALRRTAGCDVTGSTDTLGRSRRGGDPGRASGSHRPARDLRSSCRRRCDGEPRLLLRRICQCLRPHDRRAVPRYRRAAGVARRSLRPLHT